MVIYTKQGDKGRTRILDNISHKVKKVSKDSMRIEVLGTIDELNSYLGICTFYSKSKGYNNLFKSIQKDLFILGSIVAGFDISFSRNRIKEIERYIDKLETKLPEIKNFIIPSGSELSVHLFFARTLVRNLERKMVALNRVNCVRPEILEYINRLSDAIFLIAREVNRRMKVKEEVWNINK